MDWQTAGVIGATVFGTIGVMRLLAGGSWNLSGRISSIEGNVSAGKLVMQQMQTEIKRIGDVLERIADLRGDIRVLENRIANAEEDIRELQHGEGCVLPINKSAYEK